MFPEFKPGRILFAATENFSLLEAVVVPRSVAISGAFSKRFKREKTRCTFCCFVGAFDFGGSFVVFRYCRYYVCAVIV